MIYILLPAFNEADNIYALLQALDVVSPCLGDVHAVVVNDGSSDATADETNRFLGDVQVTLLNHERNSGLGAALRTGIRWILQHGEADDYMIALDADGTHHPKYMESMKDKLDAGFDIVVASRYADGGKEFGVSLFRKLLSHGARRCYRFFFPNLPVRDFSCGFRGIRLAVLQKTAAQWNDRLFEAPGFACTGELMLKMIAHTSPEKITEVPFELHYEAKGGKSKMPAFKTIIGTLRLLVQARKWNKKA